ncbi:MAG: hypothetical protein ACJAZY_000219 [Spirosomataceae bacterium]|jgi:hypothetical protein
MNSQSNPVWEFFCDRHLRYVIFKSALNCQIAALFIFFYNLRLQLYRQSLI